MTYGRTEGGCYKILAREVLRERGSISLVQNTETRETAHMTTARGSGPLRYETYADNLIAD
jgi:hypothetical protein